MWEIYFMDIFLWGSTFKGPERGNAATFKGYIKIFSFNIRKKR